MFSTILFGIAALFNIKHFKTLVLHTLQGMEQCCTQTVQQVTLEGYPV